MPRLKDLPDQYLYKLDKTTDYGPIEPLFRGVADMALVAEQWDQLVRIAASLKDRTAPAHVVLQRLINASPADRVSKALTALGRACKTLFILRYIHEEPTRRLIQRQLNRGEARHSLARWLFFANRGEFRVGDYEEVMNKASLPWPAVQRRRALEHGADRACGGPPARGRRRNRPGRLGPCLAVAARPHYPERHRLLSGSGVVIRVVPLAGIWCDG